MDMNKKNKMRLSYRQSFFAMVVVPFFVFNISSAQAYIEENNDGRTQLTAGEQNTNFNRLNNQGIVSLKKLKQIDEMMAKSPDAGDGSAQNVAEVSLLVDEQENEQIRIQSQKAKEAAKLLADKANLRYKSQQATIQVINEIAVLNQRDAQAAADLLLQLTRKKP